MGRVATGLEKSRRASSDPVEAPPKGGLMVFLDGAHMRCRPEYQQRHLDLVVGMIESRNMCRRFGLVANATASPGSRMREELSDFGWKPGRLLTVISDGELALPNLIRNAMGGDGKVKHILDWWHISMRIRRRRSGSDPDTGIHWNSGAVPAPREKPPLVALAWQSTGRGNLTEGAHARLHPPCGRTSGCPHRCRSCADPIRNTVHLSRKQHAIPCRLFPTVP